MLAQVLPLLELGNELFPQTSVRSDRSGGGDDGHISPLHFDGSRESWLVFAWTQLYGRRKCKDHLPHDSMEMALTDCLLQAPIPFP